MPCLRAPLPGARPQSLLLRCLPPAWLPSPSATSRRTPARLCQPSPKDGHRLLPVPCVRCTLARSTALRRVRRLWTAARTRWTVPALRRDGRHQRPSRCTSLDYDCGKEVISPPTSSSTASSLPHATVAPPHSASPKPPYASRRTDRSLSTVPTVRIRRNAHLAAGARGGDRGRAEQ